MSVRPGRFNLVATSTTGKLVEQMGLPVKQFLAATNVNDTVPSFLQTGVYQAKPSVQTWSNAMDVGDPSNWVRIMDLFGGNSEELKKVLTGYSYTDEETLDAINRVHADHGYIMCPHTAIAWLALKQWMNDHPSEEAAGVFLSTAHACKFPDIFPEEISSEIEIPAQVKELEDKIRVVVSLGNDFESFKKYLLGGQ